MNECYQTGLSQLWTS